MKVLDNLKINNESKKINASEIAVTTEEGKYKKLDSFLLEKYSTNYTKAAVADANEITETGGYYTNANTTNLPINGSGGFLNVMYRSDDNITQTWTRYRDNQVFMRQFNSVEPSGWKEWSRISPKLEKLWENPNKTANFSSQTITLSNDDYDYLIWFYVDTALSQGMLSNISLKGWKACLEHAYDGQIPNTANYINTNYLRNVEYVSDTSYKISNCTAKRGTENNGETKNNYCIPVLVYGGKF